MFKSGAESRGGWLMSPLAPPCAGLSFVFPVTFVLYLNNLLFESSSSPPGTDISFFCSCYFCLIFK